MNERRERDAQTGNRLAREKSPYLLQHARNPVDWFPWGEEAFATARREDKPVFLSIGYSTCHWCHVMAHESFEDRHVASLLNETFVNVKVDREERPDVDAHYMTACQMLTGSGGWPLTLVLTPDREPFFAGTYFPRDTRMGRIGMTDLVPRLAEIWRTRRTEAVLSASKIVGALEEIASGTPGEAPGEAEMEEAFRQLAGRFDETHGGFGTAPKFPTPHPILFLLRFWKRFREPRALRMATRTLEAMRAGGIWDHLGFGFHRYSTDARWLVPHFEKMLYDQAQLALAYTEAFQATGKAAFADTARNIFTYVLRDLTSPAGGFHASEDADSEGEEGRFYVWTLEEIRSVLGPEAADLFCEARGATEEGNFAAEATGRPTGANILHAPLTASALAARRGLSEAEVEARLEAAREALFRAREGRVRPFKDTKILTDWNGLMIASLARGARILGEPAFETVARKAADFILAKLRRDHRRLLHRYRDGDAALPAYLDDYAFLAWGLMELYETGFEVRYLEEAKALTDAMLEDFRDAKRGGFFFTATGEKEVPVRRKEILDGALPSGNAVALLNLLKLARITGDRRYEDRALETAEAFGGTVRALPLGHTHFLLATDFSLGPAFEVVVAGDTQGEDTRALLKALRSVFVPNKVVLFRPAGSDPGPVAALAPFTANQPPRNDGAVAYVCREGRCDLPASDAEEMLARLGAGPGAGA